MRPPFLCLTCVSNGLSVFSFDAAVSHSGCYQWKEHECGASAIHPRLLYDADGVCDDDSVAVLGAVEDRRIRTRRKRTLLRYSPYPLLIFVFKRKIDTAVERGRKYTDKATIGVRRKVGCDRLRRNPRLADPKRKCQKKA